MIDGTSNETQITTPETQYFNLGYFLEATQFILEPLRDGRGISFESVRNVYRTELIDLFPEHEEAESSAWRQLRKEHPEMSTPEIDSIAQTVAHFSRASAIVQNIQGESFTRFGQLPLQTKKAVIEAIAQSDLREPNLHVNLGQFPVIESIELNTES